MKITKVPVETPVPTIEPVVRRKVLGRIELTGPEQGEAAAGTNPDASGRPRRRGA